MQYPWLFRCHELRVEHISISKIVSIKPELFNMQTLSVSSRYFNLPFEKNDSCSRLSNNIIKYWASSFTDQTQIMLTIMKK